MKKSMIETARQIIEKHGHRMPFLDLWKEVAAEMEFNETQFNDKVSQFYTDLSMDSHFVNLEGNAWDLKTRHTLSESVIDTDSIDDDEDEDEIEANLDNSLNDE